MWMVFSCVEGTLSRSGEVIDDVPGDRVRGEPGGLLRSLEVKVGSGDEELLLFR